MKNLTTALRTGNLRPKERVMLLVKNQVAKDKTGKEILTDADKHALSEGWRPDNNEQVQEYNRYLEGANLINSANIDAQTTYLCAQRAHYRTSSITLKLLEYPRHREMCSSHERLMKIKLVNIREALDITEKQKAVKLAGGLDFDYALYQLAFESLSAEDKASMDELYPEVAYDTSYLDQEEIIANLLSGKDELSKKCKEKLATLVSEHCYNAFTKQYQVQPYFACIPLAEVARHFLVDKGVTVAGKPLAQNQECDDEDSDTHDAIQAAMEAYAKEHDVTIEAMLKSACLKWLDGDLFEQYTPLPLSDSDELFERWLKAKREAGAALKKLIDKGELKVKGRPLDESRRDKLYSKRLYDDELEKSRLEMGAIGMELVAKSDSDDRVAFATFSDTVLTGESLYALKSDWAFVKDFKKSVDTYDANLGMVYADDDPGHEGDNLDQELLIADTDKDGELAFYSTFGLSARRLGSFIKGGTYFDEVEKDGETFLAFCNKELEEMFIERKNELVEGYAILLSFNEMLEKASKIFEVDVSFKTKAWLEDLGRHIDNRNKALDQATGKLRDEDKKLFLYTKPILKIDSALYIDKENIKPRMDEAARHYFEKFEQLFGSDFGSYEKEK